tara:strand:+ start:863 stop:1012 length:150 start_codon:yes stop_codon:yes gene_type:complete
MKMVDTQEGAQHAPGIALYDDVTVHIGHRGVERKAPVASPYAKCREDLL